MPAAATSLRSVRIRPAYASGVRFWMTYTRFPTGPQSGGSVGVSVAAARNIVVDEFARPNRHRQRYATIDGLPGKEGWLRVRSISDRASEAISRGRFFRCAALIPTVALSSRILSAQGSANCQPLDLLQSFTSFRSIPRKLGGELTHEVVRPKVALRCVVTLGIS